MIRSVEKALQILSTLGDAENKPVTVTHISEHTGIHRSTCSHILETLVKHGYAERISHSKGYILGPEAYCLSRYGKYSKDIITVCKPIMKWLYAKTGYPVILAKIKGEKKFVIETIDYEHKIPIQNQTIYQDDIYRTATGRAILANLEQGDLAEIFKEYSVPEKDIWPEVTSFETLKKELSNYKKNDIFVTSHTATSTETTAVGYGGAIYQDSVCVAAIGVAIITKKGEKDTHCEEEIKQALKRAIREINRRLAARPM